MNLFLDKCLISVHVILYKGASWFLNDFSSAFLFGDNWCFVFSSSNDWFLVFFVLDNFTNLIFSNILSLFMDQFFIFLNDNILILLVNDWLMNFMNVLLLNDRLMNFMDHRLMSFMNYILLSFFNNIFVMFVDNVLVLLSNDRSSLLNVNNRCILMCFNFSSEVQVLDLWSFLMLNNDILLKDFVYYWLGLCHQFSGIISLAKSKRVLL